MQRHDPKEAESAEESSKRSQPNDQPVDPPPSNAYKIAKWTNHISNQGSKLSKVHVDPSSGKPISSGYKTVKWTDMSPEGSQISAASDNKLVKWTDMSRQGPQCVDPQLPSRDYNVVKWTNASISEGSQLIKAPVDLGGYKIVKWTDKPISQELGETPVDATGMMTRHDYKIVKWVDMSKDGSQKETLVHPSHDNGNRTVQSAASEGFPPSTDEFVDPEVSSDGC